MTCNSSDARVAEEACLKKLQVAKSEHSDELRTQAECKHYVNASTFSASAVCYRDARGERKEGQESKQEPRGRTHREQSRPSNTGRHRTQQRRKKPRRNTNQPETQQSPMAQFRTSGAPKGHQHRHQMETCASGTRPRSMQDKSKGAALRHATEAPEPAKPRQ
jgi:hypothetical protein